MPADLCFTSVSHCNLKGHCWIHMSAELASHHRNYSAFKNVKRDEMKAGWLCECVVEVNRCPAMSLKTCFCVSIITIVVSSHIKNNIGVKYLCMRWCIGPLLPTCRPLRCTLEMWILKWIFDPQYRKSDSLPKIVKRCSLSLFLSQPQACVVQPCKVRQCFYSLLWAFSNFPGEETKQSEALVWCRGDPVTNTAVNLASLQTDVLALRSIYRADWGFILLKGTLFLWPHAFRTPIRD